MIFYHSSSVFIRHWTFVSARPPSTGIHLALLVLLGFLLRAAAVPAVLMRRALPFRAAEHSRSPSFMLQASACYLWWIGHSCPTRIDVCVGANCLHLLNLFFNYQIHFLAPHPIFLA
jgi:hypothetical protein